MLDEKIRILEVLVNNYNDGRSKGFYCLAVNLLDLDALKDIMVQIDRDIDPKDISLKEKAGMIKSLFEAHACKEGIELKLRK